MEKSNIVTQIFEVNIFSFNENEDNKNDRNAGVIWQTPGDDDAGEPAIFYRKWAGGMIELNQSGHEILITKQCADEIFRHLVERLGIETSIQKLFRKHGEFTEEAFPDVTNYSGPLKHMETEIQEALKDPQEEEFADILLLLFSAFRLRFPGVCVSSLISAAFTKLEICKQRQYGPLNESGYREHVKDKANGSE